jgi:2-phosphoglycerate kinase
MIYLIGGVARSGKTLIRKEILKRFGISGIGTDSIRYMLSHTQENSGISHEKPPPHNGPLMWPYLDNLIYDLIEYSSEDFVIEGDVLLPEFLSKYKDNPNVKSCYIGYSNMSLDEKYRGIKENRSEGDWTKNYNEEEFKDFVKWSIERSKKYKEECESLGVSYCDMEINFEKSVDVIIKKLMD